MNLSSSSPAAILTDKPIDTDTEANRRPHAWRSAKATIACFAMLMTIFLPLARLIMASTFDPEGTHSCFQADHVNNPMP
jgi:hypothetical protein